MEILLVIIFIIIVIFLVLGFISIFIKVIVWILVHFYQAKPDPTFEMFDKNVSRALGPRRDDYFSDKEYKQAVSVELDRLEKHWRRRELFPNSLSINFEINDHNMIELDGVSWTVKKYIKLCNELEGRHPIIELIEEWNDTIQSKDDSNILSKKELHKKSLKIKKEIKKYLDADKNWKDIVEEYSKSDSGCIVSKENNVWRISYQDRLLALTNPVFIYQNAPHEVTFSYEAKVAKSTKKAKKSETEVQDAKEDIIICHNCGHQNVNLEGDRCNKCYYTIR